MSRQDMNSLLNDGIGTAVHFLEKSGEFYPFAIVKTKQGEIRHVQAIMEESLPESDDIRALLENSLREGGNSGLYETVAIISNVQLIDRTTGEESDVISVEIDDVESDPILCYVPYNLHSGAPSLGEIKASAGNRIAFFK